MKLRKQGTRLPKIITHCLPNSIHTWNDLQTSTFKYQWRSSIHHCIYKKKYEIISLTSSKSVKCDVAFECRRRWVYKSYNIYNGTAVQCWSKWGKISDWWPNFSCSIIFLYSVFLCLLPHLPHTTAASDKIYAALLPFFSHSFFVLNTAINTACVVLFAAPPFTVALSFQSRDWDIFIPVLCTSQAPSIILLKSSLSWKC